MTVLYIIYQIPISNFRNSNAIAKARVFSQFVKLTNESLINMINYSDLLRNLYIMGISFNLDLAN